MANQYKNKVVYGNQTLIDLTEDTVTASSLLVGFTAHDRSGAPIVGTASGGSTEAGSVYQDGEGYIVISDEAGGGSSSVTVEPLSVTANGTYTAPTGKAYSPVTVNVEGEVPTGEGRVNFIDYDGTILYTYSVSDFMALTELPANPSHSGLTAQGWNWTLADAKTQLTAMPDAGLTIGQMYITDDGKTRLYCRFEEGRLHPYLGIGINGTVVVDWGDGSATDTLTGTSLTTATNADHIYASAGDYTITLTVSSGSFAFFGSASGTHVLKMNSSTPSNTSAMYQNALRLAEIGTNASIGTHAFHGCHSLTSITIPDSVTSIGAYAFNYCYRLASITIPSAVTGIGSYTFSSCSSLASVTIPDGVTSIGAYAFAECYSLTSITIPDGVTSIGTYAFNQCNSLASITIPNKATSIGNYAFNYCLSLASVTIPDKNISIGTGAFCYCYSLTSITIPDSVTSIGVSAFSYCYSLTSFAIPSKIKTVGNSMFSNCYSLASVTIPDSVTSIGDSAFNACRSLASVTIPDGVTSIGNNAFFGCHSLTSITIPDGVTSIGTYAFNQCYSLASINIPSVVTSIGSYTFGSCSSLASVTIPDSVTSIGTYAFRDCSSLTSVTIPSDVTSIGTYAFNACYGLGEIHFIPTTPPTVSNSNAWTNIPTDCIIYVPAGTLEAYTSATNYPSSSTYTYVEE